MKQLFLILFAATFPASVFAQVVAIQNDHENIFYVGVPNPITVAVEDVKAKDIEIALSSGRIESSSSHPNGHYDVYVDSPRNDDTIFIYAITKAGHKKLIQQSDFRARCLPKPRAYFNGYNYGNVSQTSLLIAIALIAPVNFGYIDGRYKIVSYTTVIYRRRKEIYHKTVKDLNGARIDNETKDFFYTLKNNDRVVFKDIAIKVPGYTYTDTDPIDLTVTGAHKYRRVKVNKVQYVEDPETGLEIPKFIKYTYERVR